MESKLVWKLVRMFTKFHSTTLQVYEEERRRVEELEERMRIAEGDKLSENQYEYRENEY